jgi:D-beta-D-heptose 7-phosphate kinase/D-beta-D-heptose 1-phosphate adenosyltransferase
MQVQVARVFAKHEDLVNELNERREGRKLVCTIGSWDLLHRGHVEYLEKAKELGDILVVGVDSDIAYQRYKGKPSMFPQEDRVAILAAVGCVDYVTLVYDVDELGQWQYELPKTLMPDIFLCNYQTFSEAQRDALAKFCQRLEVVNIFLPGSYGSVATADEMKVIVRREKELTLKLRKWAFLLLFVCLSASITTTLLMVFFTAFNLAPLSDLILGALIGKTIPEIFGMMYIVVKYLFPANQRRKQGKASES